MYNTAAKLSSNYDTAELSIHTRTLSRSIFGSRLGSKQKGHGCASSMEGMLGTAAIEECCDAKVTFFKVQVTWRRGVKGTQAWVLGLGGSKSWREEKVEKWAR